MNPSNAQAETRHFSAPVGATMTITETVNSEYSVRTDAVTKQNNSPIEDGDVSNANIFSFAVTGEGAVVTFNNKRKMAGIELSKKLHGKVSTVESFDFTVTLTQSGNPTAGYVLCKDPEDQSKYITTDETGDWASRINAYLEGSPLEGYGETFAQAAAEYGVDPRLSPSIATIESGRGSICFKDHNAWGWGSSSWDSWEDAIYEHVEGLATGYDGTLTLEGAERYCPPNYQEWYSSVATEMDGI
jgi:hypothetical protein